MKGPLIVLLCIMMYVKGDEVSEVIANAKNHNYRFVIFSLKDKGTDSTLSVEAKGNRDESVADLIEKLPDDVPRYVLLDYEGYSRDDDSKQQNWLVIIWVPDQSNVKDKLTYAAEFGSFKQRFADLGSSIIHEDDKRGLKDYIMQQSFESEET